MKNMHPERIDFLSKQIIGLAVVALFALIFMSVDRNEAIQCDTGIRVIGSHGDYIYVYEYGPGRRYVRCCTREFKVLSEMDVVAPPWEMIYPYIRVVDYENQIDYVYKYYKENGSYEYSIRRSDICPNKYYDPHLDAEGNMWYIYNGVKEANGMYVFMKEERSIRNIISEVKQITADSEIENAYICVNNIANAIIYKEGVTDAKRVVSYNIKDRNISSYFVGKVHNLLHIMCSKINGNVIIDNSWVIICDQNLKRLEIYAWRTPDVCDEYFVYGDTHYRKERDDVYRYKEDMRKWEKLNDERVYYIGPLTDAVLVCEKNHIYTISLYGITTLWRGEGKTITQQ